MSFGGVEFAAESGDGGVVNGVGLALEFDTQFFAGGVGTEVDGGVHEAAHEAAAVVGAFEGFAGELDEGGLGAVGDELDGVDEVFSAAAKLLGCVGRAGGL